MNIIANKFDYEDTFMGVALDAVRGYEQKLLDKDYRLKVLIKIITLKKRERLLDVGCGGGGVTETLTFFYPTAEIHGCDISKTAISYGKKFGSGKVKYANIINKKLPYNDNFFDVCICLDVLEHVPDIDFFINEIKRVLRKNGLFYLAVPCEGQPVTLTWLFQKIKIGNNLTFKYFGHIHPEFTHRSIGVLLKKHNFLTIKRFYSNHLLSQILQFFKYFLPKELLEMVFGAKKAQVYSDKSIVKSNKQKKLEKDPLMWLRTIWIKLSGMTDFVGFLELALLKDVSLTSWKLLILTKNIK